MEPLYIVLITAGAGIVSALVSAAISRRSEKESNDVQEELGEFQILRGTVDALQKETDRLSTSLDKANQKAEHLNRELDAAQANVRILSRHIRQYVPEEPFPKLRSMNADG